MDVGLLAVEGTAVAPIDFGRVSATEVASAEKHRGFADGETRGRSGGLLAAARAGSREALGRVLEGCRRYLLGVAEGELDPDLRSKGGASDIVQETFLEAQRDFARFQGSSPEELRAWLRQVLVT